MQQYLPRREGGFFLRGKKGWGRKAEAPRRRNEGTHKYDSWLSCTLRVRSLYSDIIVSGSSTSLFPPKYSMLSLLSNPIVSGNVSSRLPPQYNTSKLDNAPMLLGNAVNLFAVRYSFCNLLNLAMASGTSFKRLPARRRSRSVVSWPVGCTQTKTTAPSIGSGDVGRQEAAKQGCQETAAPAAAAMVAFACFAMASVEDGGGRWRTVGGRKVDDGRWTRVEERPVTQVVRACACACVWEGEGEGEGEGAGHAPI